MHHGSLGEGCPPIVTRTYVCSLSHPRHWSLQSERVAEQKSCRDELTRLQKEQGERLREIQLERSAAEKEQREEMSKLISSMADLLTKRETQQAPLAQPPAPFFPSTLPPAGQPPQSFLLPPAGQFLPPSLQGQDALPPAAHNFWQQPLFSPQLGPSAAEQLQMAANQRQEDSFAATAGIQGQQDKQVSIGRQKSGLGEYCDNLSSYPIEY